MAKFLSDRTAQRLGPALDAIESLAPRKRNAPRRRIRTRQEESGSVRSWAVITSVTSPSEYTGNILASPGGQAIETGVTILVYGAMSNEFSVGYAAFADKAVDSENNEVYYLDGFVLG
ncbi:MAG: hypothetical protein GY928_24170 [Colwellia sp.]|nr:hypothetical protein [Colwellia sp.]